MKRSKKVLALLLGLSLTLGMISVPAMAEAPGPGDSSGMGGVTAPSTPAEFADAASITQTEAVGVLMRLGVISGVKGDDAYSFLPANSIDRASTAKMIATVVTLVNGGELNGATVFSDSSASWARDYISFCADQGLIHGDGQGHFFPSSAVTGVQLAKMLLAANGVTEGLTGSGSNAVINDLAQAAGLYEDIAAVTSEPISRENAARMIYNALISSSGSAALPRLRMVSETMESTSLTIGENDLFLGSDHRTLTMTVNGVQTRMAPGTYTGTVVLTPAQGVVVSNMGMDSTLRMAAYIKDNKLVADASVSSAILSGVVGDTSASGLKINSQDDDFAGIVVDGDSSYTVKDVDITLNGHGRDDFAGTSAGLSVRGNATLTVDNANIDTTGSIRTAIWAGENAKLIVKNSKIVGRDGDDLDFAYSMMNEVPWVLGLKGNLRSTGLLGSAQATYLNSWVEAENWGALSTDSNSVGATLTAINTDVIISGESGYGSYADQQVQNFYYGCRFDVPDMALVVAAGQCGAVFGKTTQANTGDFYNEIAAGHKDEATVINADSFGVMWHKNQNGVVTVKENTIFNTGETVFLVKSDLANTAYPVLNVDDSTLNSKSGVILHLMEADDAGMGGGAPGSSDMWAKFYEVPVDTTPVDDGSDPTVVADTTMRAAFSNMEVKGDIYNSRFTAGQNLAVTFTNADVTGVISAGTQAHKDTSPGSKITKDEYNKIGHVVVTPAEAVCNGMIVTLDKDSTWTVTGVSYLTSLTFETAGSIKGVITVDGKTVTAPGVYTGNIVVSPAR